MADLVYACNASQTGGFEPFTSTSGTVTMESTITRVGQARSWKHDTSSPAANAVLIKNDVMADAGRRISFWRRFASVSPAADAIIAASQNTSLANVWLMHLRTDGKLQANGVGAPAVVGNTVLSVDTWYRIGLSYVITSTTNFEIRVYLNGVLEITISSNGTLTNTGSDSFRMTMNSAAGDNFISYSDELAIDNGADLADIFAGDTTTGCGVTAAKPDETNAGNFDTTGGTGAVNEVPISETNYKQHAAATDVQQNYTLQTASETTPVLTGKTYVGHVGWLWAKRSSVTNITAGNSGTEASAASGDITLNAPSSPQNPSLWIAVIHSADNAAHTLTDWTQIAQFNGGGTGSRLSVWYFRYAGNTPNLVVGHTSGGTIVGGIKEFRGVKASGDPVNTLGSETTGTGTQTGSGITPSVDGCAVLFCTGRGDDDNYSAITGYTVAFEDTAGGTQNNYQSSAGTPDGSMGMYFQIQTTATATGTLTATTAATDPWASIILALEPEDTLGTPKIMLNGTETAVVLSSTSAFYSNVVTSASYPSNAAGIGMASGTGRVDKFLYECGCVIVYYTPAGATETPNPVSAVSSVVAATALLTVAANALAMVGGVTVPTNLLALLSDPVLAASSVPEPTIGVITDPVASTSSVAGPTQALIAEPAHAVAASSTTTSDQALAQEATVVVSTHSVAAPATAGVSEPGAAASVSGAAASTQTLTLLPDPTSVVLSVPVAQAGRVEEVGVVTAASSVSPAATALTGEPSIIQAAASIAAPSAELAHQGSPVAAQALAAAVSQFLGVAAEPVGSASSTAAADQELANPSTHTGAVSSAAAPTQLLTIEQSAVTAAVSASAPSWVATASLTPVVVVASVASATLDLAHQAGLASSFALATQPEASGSSSPLPASGSVPVASPSPALSTESSSSASSSVAAPIPALAFAAEQAFAATSAAAAAPVLTMLLGPTVVVASVPVVTAATISATTPGGSAPAGAVFFGGGQAGAVVASGFLGAAFAQPSTGGIGAESSSDGTAFSGGGAG